MIHKHNWREDKTRTHGRPPRFFAICACNKKAQAVWKETKDGTLYIHAFWTKVSTGHALKNYSIRLTERQYQDIRFWKKAAWPERETK